MLKRTGTGRSRRPIDVRYWKFRLSQPDTLIIRPTFRTFLHRLWYTVALGALGYGIWQLGLYLPPYPLPESFYLEIAVATYIWAILAPVSCLWQNITIQRMGRQRLSIRRFFVIPRTFSVPLHDILNISVIVSELHGRAYARNRYMRWRWRVLVLGDGIGIEFWSDSQHERPDEGQLSSRTAQFVQALQKLIPVSYTGPQILDRRPMPRRPVQRVSQRIEIPVAETTRRRTYHSREEVPPEQRPEFDEMVQEAKRKGVDTVHRQRITIRDNKGNARTYNSAEDMPPKVREWYERQLRKRAKKSE